MLRYTRVVPRHRYYTTFAVWRDNVCSHQTKAVDVVTASPLNLLANTLNESALPFKHNVMPESGTIVPATYHHVYFPPRTPEEALASDGYETDFVPPPPYVQRLWGGAELTFSSTNPLRVGDSVTMTTTVDRVEQRAESSVFVWLNKDIYNTHGWSMREKRCLVYLHQDASPSSRPISAKKSPQFSQTILPTPILLFRYSALTFNAHLIHYDHIYATTVENHRARLVHGPLSGTLLMSLLRSHLSHIGDALDESKVASFQYRCLKPLYVNEPIKLCGRQSEQGVTKTYDLWAENYDGHLAVKGRVEILH